MMTGSAVVDSGATARDIDGWTVAYDTPARFLQTNGAAKPRASDPSRVAKASAKRGRLVGECGDNNDKRRVPSRIHGRPRLPDDESVAGQAVQNLLGDTPDQHLEEGAAPMRAEHDEVCLVVAHVLAQEILG